MSGGSEVMTTTTINATTNTNKDPSAFTLTPPAPSQSHSHIQNMRVSYAADGSAIFKPSTTTPHYPVQAPPEGGPPATGIQGININNMGDYHQPPPIKKKRGRPRKYVPDGSMALAVGGGAPANSSVPVTHPPPHVSQQQHQHVPLTVTQPSQHPQLSAGAVAGFSPPVNAVASGIMNPGEEGVALSPSSMKKRGRPPGSGKKHRLEALGSAGFGFTPHIITVKAGEDVSSKIMAFSQHGPRAVCILSANGSISNVTLRQPATSGGTVTYEGRFEILSLSGSYLPSEDGGQRSRTGGLSVTLSSSDGCVLGGSVVGLLVAATPVQVVVGSFVADGGKDSKPVNHIEPLSATMRLASGGGSTGASSPQSRATLSESSGGPGSPLNQITSASNTSNPQGMSGISWK